MGGCLQFLLLSWPEETKQGGERLRGSCLPGCQASCQPPSQAFLKPARPETATAAVAGAQEDGHQDGEMEGGSWAKMALPAPPCPAPTTA